MLVVKRLEPKLTPVDTAAPQAFSGIRVIDMTRNLAGPFCAMRLADLLTTELLPSEHNPLTSPQRAERA